MAARVQVAGDGGHTQVQLPLLHEDALQVVPPHGPGLHQHVMHLHSCRECFVGLLRSVWNQNTHTWTREAEAGRKTSRSKLAFRTQSKLQVSLSHAVKPYFKTYNQPASQPKKKKNEHRVIVTTLTELTCGFPYAVSPIPGNVTPLATNLLSVLGD